MFKAKLGKASSFDNIPIDIFRNDCSVSYLHVLFNVCFNSGILPTHWCKVVIAPIPKSSTADPRDPL